MERAVAEYLAAVPIPIAPAPIPIPVTEPVAAPKATATLAKLPPRMSAST